MSEDIVFYNAPTEVADSVRISLLTCMPGEEIYALCGHSALRVQTEKGDSVWNYGLFSFQTPNFVYRFVKGETDYMAGAYPTAWFLPEYQQQGRRVYEQELLLTGNEKEELLTLLHNDIKPENSTYRYSYIYDNCATRIRDRIESVSGPLTYSDTLHYGTFRREMKAHHTNYPWYQFGIDIALGSELDRPVTPREEMFSPDEMMRRIGEARRGGLDGEPIAAEATVLVDGSDAAIAAPTPFLLGPMAASLALLAGSIIAVLAGFKRQRPIRWWYSLYFALAGLAGCIVAFLVFISSHSATSPNMLLLWLNPLQLIPAVTVWWRKGCIATKIMMVYNLVVVGAAALLWIFGRQSGNAAFIPLVLCDLILSAAWLLQTGDQGADSQGRGKKVSRKSGRRTRKQ